ncbi:hypothetical protein F4818DRAFT_438679 [Hypoxylon cercidicola]|nr:hypothetical protein F4818DRAFT_438679 [Hypoxylon cercidicola]
MNSSNILDSLQDSPGNHGAVINIVSWFLLICSSLLVLTRLGTKYGVSKSFNVDDGFIVVSLILSIGQTIAISIGVANGLGRHLDTLSSDGIVAFQKSYYAANVLFVASQAFSKLSIIFFVRHISPIAFHRTLAWILTGATLVWAFSSILMLLFQCDTPRVWDAIANKCNDQRAIWNYINVVNIVVDVCLIWLPFAVVWRLQVRFQRKLVVMSCFATRILTIAAIAWQVEESQTISNHQDLTFTYWLLAVSMSLVQSLGIMTACTPYLKSFLDSLESGLIRSDDIRRRANATGKSISGYGRQDASSVASQSKPVRDPPTELRDLGHPNATVTASITVKKTQSGGDWETGSHSSQVKLIKQVKTWRVTSSPDPKGEDEYPVGN